MTKRAFARLSRLERKLERKLADAMTPLDLTTTRAYEALSDEDEGKLHSYVDRFNEGALTPFSDEELNDFERILKAFVLEEG